MTIYTRTSPDRTQVALAGVVDDHADFAPLLALRGTVEINLRGVRRFTSAGIRGWVEALRTLCQRARIVFVECSPAVVEQLNRIQGFLGHGTVKSFQGPMCCDCCGFDIGYLFQTDECRELDALPPVRCSKCGQYMQLDDLEDSYLLFIREPTLVGDDSQPEGAAATSAPARIRWRA